MRYYKRKAGKYSKPPPGEWQTYADGSKWDVLHESSKPVKQQVILMNRGDNKCDYQPLNIFLLALEVRSAAELHQVVSNYLLTCWGHMFYKGNSDQFD
jgi:hypothetical protein